MVYRGHVKNGVVVLDEPCGLPEGAEVRVNPVAGTEVADQQQTIPSLYDRLAPFIGAAEGLPPDLSTNHDHYLYGTPKRP
jgi:hypothetical protein